VLPSNIIEVHVTLNTSETVTSKNEPFVLINNQEKYVIIFSCMTNLIFVNTVDTIYVDGTFQYCARFFTQMFTIHGFQNGHYIPFIFCLLPDKKYETYLYMLNAIIDKCKEINLNFSPTHITIDFELAIYSAVDEIWPLSKRVGCRFHLTQAWYRNIQQYGLATEYKTNSDIGKWIKYTFGLLYLDPKEVSDCFVEDLMLECPTDDRVTKYCDYLVNNYISEDSTFPPCLWACN